MDITDIFRLCYNSNSGINNKNEKCLVCSDEELQYKANKFTEVINTIYNQNIDSVSNTISTHKDISNTDDIFDIFKYLTVNKFSLNP